MHNLRRVNWVAGLALAVGILNISFVHAATASGAIVASRVLLPVDDGDLVVLRGNTHPLAKPKYDQGLVDSGKLLERMVLVLRRSPAQEQALAAFNERQNDPTSSDYHHWIHAEEFGRLYGPSDADLAAVTGWLTNHGFRIDLVSKGRVTIQFTGTVAQVQSAFHVQMHRYLVSGEQHIANDRDPQIPAALAPVVTGVASLNDFFAKPQMVYGKLVKRDRRTGRITLLGQQSAGPPASGKSPPINPQLTYVDSSGDTHEDLTPYDYATIYNILPLWNAGTNGKGVTIAISGVSDIDTADFNNFRKTFGLPASTLKVIHNGADPGADGGGGQGENTLDVEMAGATAPGATIDLVVSASTSTTGGDQLSDEYIIDNEIAPIMSGSYGECELALGTAANAGYNKVWQQGATEGISIFESAGDQGSAGCSDSDQPGPNADEIGLQVNGVASSPYLTAVGGTDFTWSFISGGVAKYWNSTNDAQGATAKGILPEVPWNSSCANPLLVALFGATSNEQLCNALITFDDAAFEGLIVITGGSGGESHCTTPSGSTSASCSGGYAKPSWQAGPGVPADGKRDLPDVSLFASAGFPSGINGSAILFCEAIASPTGTCDYTNRDYVIYQEIGGTSASSPLMAGVMALVLQQTGAAQGLANPVFYTLAQNQATAGTACNSSTVANGNTCVFYDISAGTNSQVCITGDPNCVTKTSGDQLGLLSGYAATKGYDQAIGLGSVNVANLVDAWTSAAPTPTVSVTPSSLSFAATKVGATSAAQTVTVKNTGTVAVALTSGGITFTGTDASSFLKSATTCAASLAVGASCTISVEFKPAAAGSLTAKLSIADNAAGSPQTVSLGGTGTSASAPVASLSPTSLAFANTVSGSTSEDQVVTLKNTGTATLAISAVGLSGTNATSFVELNGCGATLAAGASCSIYVAFDPKATGALTASLSVTDNAAGSPQKVTLSGTGTAVPSVKLSATSLSFASTAPGATTAPQAVTVTNGGTATLELTSIGLTGTNPADFETVNNCGPTLAAGASCTIYVAFKPAAAGSFKASLSVADSGSGSPQSVTLGGTGT